MNLMSTIYRFNDGKRWRWHITRRDQSFRQPLVQREHITTIGKRVGNSIYVENGWSLPHSRQFPRDLRQHAKTRSHSSAAGQSSDEFK